MGPSRPSSFRSAAPSCHRSRSAAPRADDRRDPGTRSNRMEPLRIERGEDVAQRVVRRRPVSITGGSGARRSRFFSPKREMSVQRSRLPPAPQARPRSKTLVERIHQLADLPPLRRSSKCSRNVNASPKALDDSNATLPHAEIMEEDRFRVSSAVSPTNSHHWPGAGPMAGLD